MFLNTKRARCFRNLEWMDPTKNEYPTGVLKNTPLEKKKNYPQHPTLALLRNSFLDKFFPVVDNRKKTSRKNADAAFVGGRLKLRRSARNDVINYDVSSSSPNPLPISTISHRPTTMDRTTFHEINGPAKIDESIITIMKIYL